MTGALREAGWLERVQFSSVRGRVSMTVSVSLLICSTVALVISTPPPEDGGGHEGERAVQPLSAAMSGNYTVSFAPLLAVLINVFPRLMSAMRLPAQPLTATAHARGLDQLWEWERASVCSAFEVLVPAEGDCLFYSCSPGDATRCPRHHQAGRLTGNVRRYRGTELVSETDVDECTRLSARRCRDPRARYRPDVDACVPAIDAAECF